MIKSILSAATVFCCLCCARQVNADSNKLSLRLHVQPGQSFRSVDSSQTSGAMYLAGQLVQFGENKIISSENEVLRVAGDGSVTVRSTLTGVSMTEQFGNSNSSYSSTSPTLSPMGALVNSIIGASVTVVYAADGRLKSVSGLNAVYSQLTRARNFGSSEERQVATRHMQQRYGDRSQEGRSDFELLLPGRPISIGGTWSDNGWQSESGITAPMKLTSTLSDSHDGIAVVSLNIGKAPGRAFVDTDVPTRASFSYNGGGSEQIDEATGWLIRRDTLFTGRGEMVVTNTDGDQVVVPIAMICHEQLVTTNLEGESDEVSVTPE